MRKGTFIAIALLFVVIIGVAVVQIAVASGDRAECPGPVTTPDALPASSAPASQECR